MPLSPRRPILPSFLTLPMFMYPTGLVHFLSSIRVPTMRKKVSTIGTKQGRCMNDTLAHPNPGMRLPKGWVGEPRSMRHGPTYACARALCPLKALGEGPLSMNETKMQGACKGYGPCILHTSMAFGCCGPDSNRADEVFDEETCGVVCGFSTLHVLFLPGTTTPHPVHLFPLSLTPGIWMLLLQDIHD